MKSINVRLTDTAYELLKTTAANNHRSLNDQIIAAIEGPLFEEDDVDQAREYLKTLQAIATIQPDWTEDDVVQARDYLATLRAIEEVQPDWTDEDVEQAHEYLRTLREIDAVR
jgi:hypothetical protein